MQRQKILIIVHILHCVKNKLRVFLCFGLSWCHGWYICKIQIVQWHLYAFLATSTIRHDNSCRITPFSVETDQALPGKYQQLYCFNLWRWKHFSRGGREGHTLKPLGCMGVCLEQFPCQLIPAWTFNSVRVDIRTLYVFSCVGNFELFMLSSGIFSTLEGSLHSFKQYVCHQLCERMDCPLHGCATLAMLPLLLSSLHSPHPLSYACLVSYSVCVCVCVHVCVCECACARVLFL